MNNDLTVKIETQRLRLILFQYQHLMPLHRIYGNPEVMQFIPDGARSIEQVEQELSQFISDWETNGLAPFAVIDKSSNQLIGRSGLYYNRTRSPFPQLGYILAPEFHGQGLAVECAKASLAYGFEKRHFNQIDAFVRKDNKVSCHILSQKLFMNLESEFLLETNYYCKYTLQLSEYLQKQAQLQQEIIFA
jgi:RimJ/RimL family protein N-acetyltransferase